MEPLETSKSDIPEHIRLILQSSIIKDAGKYFTCQGCKKKYHILDLIEDCWKIVDIPRLRYICEKCNLVVVEASG
jgi:hypothetical protein